MSPQPAHDPAPTTAKKLDELYKLIEGIEIAMFTTRRPDGSLVSRPMSTQERVTGTDLWFAADISSGKFDDLRFDPHVNLAYYNLKSREWVSVSGTAVVTQDRKIIKELYKPDWKAWFGDNGGEEDGSASDPRIALIMVDAHRVEYMVSNKPKPVVLFQVAKGILTGSKLDIGEQRTLSQRELNTDSAKKAR